MKIKQQKSNKDKNCFMKFQIESSSSDEEKSGYVTSDYDESDEESLKLANKIEWKRVKSEEIKVENEKNSENFNYYMDLDVGPNIPYSYFIKFIDDTIANKIVQETKRYINHKLIEKSKKKREQNNKKSFNTNECNLVSDVELKMKEEIKTTQEKVTVNMIKKYIAIILLMGIVKVPNSKMFWSNSDLFGNRYFKRIMSGKTFSFMNEFLHFNDSEFEKASTDKLYKISPIIDYMNSKWNEHMPPNDKKIYTIDESMVPYRGRLKMRQYIPSKPQKYGIKIYCLNHAESSYVQRWQIYTGKAYGGLKPIQVVNTFIDFCKPNSHLFFDSLFSSFKLFQELINRDFYFTASLSKARLGFPIKPKEKEMEQYESKFSQFDSITHVFWKSNQKILSMCSNFYQNNTRLVSDKSKTITFQKPEMIYRYNLLARGVDKHNQLCSYYVSNRKTIKWYRKIFFYVIEACLVNSYILYKMNKNKKMSLLNFQLAIIQGLSNIYLDFNYDINQNFTEIRQNELQGNHFLERGDYRKDCVICSKKSCRKMTWYRCEICRVHLHETTCFKLYHTKRNHKK